MKFIMFSVSIGAFIMLYYGLYRFFQKPMIWIFTRLQMIEDEDEVNQSFSLFAFYSFLITFLITILITFILVIAYFWYYSVGVISFILFILFDKDVKHIYYLKGALFLLLISFLIIMYPYRNILLHG